MHIQFSPSALCDLEALLEYYDNQGIADKGKVIVSELITAIEALSDYPEMGRIVPEFNTSTLRELIRNPYRVVYRLDAECISIIRVWRSERLLNLDDSETK